MLEEYKGISGIYKLTCIVEGSFTNEIYFGQGYCLKSRIDGHVRSLNTKRHGNKFISNIFHSQPEEVRANFENVFQITIIRTLSPQTREHFSKEDVKTLLTRMEQCYLTAFNPRLNICKEAGTTLGTTRTRESIEKGRASKLGDEHKNFTLYHEIEGEIKGENLGFYIKDNNLTHGLYHVFRGEVYQYRGYYKTKEYFLDRSRWEEDYPIPKSDYPGVNWCRKVKAWKAAPSQNGQKYLGFFEQEEDAIEAIEKFKLDNPVEIKLEPFEIFNSKKGVVKGEILLDYCRDNGIKATEVRQVMSGDRYAVGDYYKCEEYYKDKKAWHRDYPPITSYFSGVYWSRTTKKWQADGRVNNRIGKHLGSFLLEEDAIATVLKYEEEKGIKRKPQSYCLYHPARGVVSGEYLLAYTDEHKLCPAELRDVMEGRLYKSQGHYLSEEYYLDKNKWLSDHPLPVSRFPNVIWDRRKDKWKAYKNMRISSGKWKQKNLGNYDDDYEANLAVLDYCDDQGLSIKAG